MESHFPLGLLGFLVTVLFCFCCSSKCSVTETPGSHFPPGIFQVLWFLRSLSNLIRSLLTFAKELSELKGSFVCSLSVTHPSTSPSLPPSILSAPPLLCLHLYLVFVFSSLQIPLSFALPFFTLPSLHPSFLHPSISSIPHPLSSYHDSPLICFYHGILRQQQKNKDTGGWPVFQNFLVRVRS